MTARSLTISGSTYPLVLPNVRDPRLHVAAVIISIHVLGQVGLHFRVSVPQILAAIATCAAIEIVLTFRQSGALVWPASAMLTGSGVALILRIAGTPPDDPWNTNGWYVYAIVAGLSLLTKYVIRYRGSHVFNPSNVGLVAAFLILGSSRAEPLDFWWSPLNGWMLAAYAVILVGGILITRRLRLIQLAATFWLALAAGIGLLSASGHCMAARWAFDPVCGGDFWRVIVTSPEVLIFLFFMITDPKTVPTGRVARVVFGLLVAVVSTLLMAPQTDEFGTKVALLSGLVIVCALRPLVERLAPDPGGASDSLRAFAQALGGWADRPLRAGRTVIRLGVGALALLVVSAGIVLAGTPARGGVVVNSPDVLSGVPHQVDPATFPAISLDVPAWEGLDGQSIARGVLVTLAENLEVENQALLRQDGAILTAVDHGDRLREMQGVLASSIAAGRFEAKHYSFASVHVVVVAPFGVQTNASLGFESRGTVTTETYDAAHALVGRQTQPFAFTFVVRRPTGDRWMTVAVQPLP